MKIQLKNIKSNPFRRFEDYPIVEWKVEALRNSIKNFTFWDNLLVRKNKTELNPKGEYQLAYGHHRLEAAVAELGEDYSADLAVKELTDETMLKILLEENNSIYTEDGKLNVKAFDSGIKQAWEFLIKLYNPDYITQKKGGRHILHFKELPIPKHHRDDPDGFHHSCLSKQIQIWLGENHSEAFINNSLTRLRNDGTISFPQRTKDEKGKAKTVMMKSDAVLDREAVNTMPTNKAAKFFTSLMIEIALGDNAIIDPKKQGSVSPARQKKIAKNLNKKSEGLLAKDVYSQTSILIEAVRVIDGDAAAAGMEQDGVFLSIEDLQKKTNNLMFKYRKVNRMIEDGIEDDEYIDLFKSGFEKFKLGFAIVKLSKEIFLFNKNVGKVENGDKIDEQKLLNGGVNK